MSKLTDILRLTEPEPLPGLIEMRCSVSSTKPAIPILFTTLDRLKAGGPRDAVWWRCGHGRWQTLPDALANPADHDAWRARDQRRRLEYERAEEKRR